ncbi:hypothetical protein KPH14_012995, partial [Odynerus spinipes]
MCDRQHGFMKGKSTESAWECLKKYVSESECKYVLGVFVDFQGAFDNLEWKSVFEMLVEFGCDEIEIGLWRSYFSNRWVCMEGVNGVVWKEVLRGCPQGSISGPFIWDLMMDRLLWALVNAGFKCVAYADDLVGVVEGMSRAELERKGARLMHI